MAKASGSSCGGGDDQRGRNRRVGTLEGASGGGMPLCPTGLVRIELRAFREAWRGIAAPHQFSKNWYPLNVDGQFDPCNVRGPVRRLVSGHKLKTRSHDYLTLPGHFGPFEPLGPSKTQ